MKPVTFPKLMLPDSGSRGAPTLGRPLVDDYIESVHARLRPNSMLAVVYDLKVFFTVVDVDPLDIRRHHVLEFIRVQRTGSTDATVIPIDQSEGLALSTIRRRLSTVAGFYAHLCALGKLDHNPVQRGMPVRAPVTRDRRVIPLVRPVRHLPQILDHGDVIKLVEHPLGDPGAQHPFGDHVDVALEKIAQIHHESTEVEQISIGFEVDEEVDIAGFGASAACDGTEHPDPRCTAGARELDDLLAPPPTQPTSSRSLADKNTSRASPETGSDP